VLLEVDQRWPAVAIHLEGIPSVATASVNTAVGPVTASIGLFEGTARVRLDRTGRYWAGIGTEILAQRTPITGLSRIDSSRLSGTRYELATTIPISDSRFFELDLGAVPHMNGTVYESTTFFDGFIATQSGQETASMVDLGASFGVRHGGTEFLYGLRSINFAAKFSDGHEADRNVGIGLTAEVRFTI
jgi:hypothetical protein